MTFSDTKARHLRQIDATDLLKLGAPFVLVAVLLTPSIWMLIVIPPLWRDVDAYLQVTLPPGPETILQYEPLYCFAARIPLYLGYAIDSVRAGHSLPALGFFIHPVLTDSGVFVLLLVQHAAFCFAGFYLITAASGIFSVRLILALAWAANPLLYSFAHCVGGETLSMILIILIGATGLRIVRCDRKFPGKAWVLFGILLCLCILTRHINAALAGLLPLTFFMLVVYRLIRMRFGRTQLLSRSDGAGAREAFQKGILAVAVGICCVLLANALLRVVSNAAKTPYRSPVGLAFLGRLKFLAKVPVEKRNELLDKVVKNTDSADVKNLIELLRNDLSGKSDMDVSAFRQKAQAYFSSPQTDPGGQVFHVTLHRATLAFLYPPQEILLAAVATDFERSQRITIPDVVAFLFVTTRFYFSHRDVMPQCASLTTFRSKNADQIFAVFKKHSYLRHPKNVSYRGFLFMWIVLFAAFVVIAKVRKLDVAGVASYAIAMIVIAVLIMLANCLLAVFQPRYTLPMWELTIVSLFILFGGTMNALLYQSGRLHSPELNEQRKRSA